jgi:predicted small integral membrane protein
MVLFLLLKGALVGGTGLWLALIAINNVADPNTNRTLLYRMFSMEGIEPESAMGGGLARRATKSKSLPRVVLACVVAQQFATAALMIRSAVLLMGAAFSSALTTTAEVQAANIALLLFASMWFLFLCGGLWFGYWITMPAVQLVHVLMLIVTLGLVLVINA